MLFLPIGLALPFSQRCVTIIHPAFSLQSFHEASCTSVLPRPLCTLSCFCQHLEKWRAAKSWLLWNTPKTPPSCLAPECTQDQAYVGLFSQLRAGASFSALSQQQWCNLPKLHWRGLGGKCPGGKPLRHFQVSLNLGRNRNHEEVLSPQPGDTCTTIPENRNTVQMKEQKPKGIAK